MPKSIKNKPTKSVILFNKPYGVMCQFTDTEGRPTLADYINDPNYYAAGRLDMDSEGLIVLTDDGVLQNRLSDPKHKLAKTYWVQVEGVPDDVALKQLRNGVLIQGKTTLPAEAKTIDQPDSLWPRDPPIRIRKNIADSWIELKLTEGRNRQVKRMTAAVGHPTLRLIRYAVGNWTLDNLAPGSWAKVNINNE